MDNIEEIIELAMHYLRGIWKQRWLAILVAWPVMIAGILFVDILPDKYTASTRVYIDTTSVLKPLLKGITIQNDFRSNVKLMSQKVLSRPNIERAARQLDLDIDVKDNLEMEKLINKIIKNSSLSSSSRTDTYTIAFADKDPKISLGMVQILLDIFIEDTLGKSSKESDTAISFLDNQIKKYDTLLSTAESRVENFKRKNIGLMPENGNNYYQELKSSNSKLEKAKLEHQELTNRKEQLSLKLSELPSKTPIEDEFESKFQTRIDTLELEIDELLLLYTEQHPDVESKKRILKSLKQKQEIEKAEFSQKEKTQFSISNPVAQELTILLTKTEAKISSLNARIAAFTKQTNDLKARVNVIPKIEAELARLNRDYRIHKENYNQLVTRREQAKISEDVETGTDQVKFRIIEPPNVPSLPSFPNRPLFDIAVLFFSLIVGYGIALLRSLMQPVFYNAPELHKMTNIAVLGAITKIDTPLVIKKRKQNILLFFSANILLILTNVAFVAAHLNNVLLVNTLKSLGLN